MGSNQRVKYNSSDNKFSASLSIWLSLVLLCVAWKQGYAAGAVMYSGVAGGDNDSIVYLGASIPFKGSRLGKGWVGKYWIDQLKYRYTSDDEIISATAPGVEASIAYMGGDFKMHYGVSLGFTYRYTELTPDQPDSDVRGGISGAKLQLDGGYAFSQQWQGSATAFYDTGSSLYWLSSKLLHGFRNNISLGPELAVFGNPDFRTKQGGLVVSGIKLTESVRLGLQAYLKKSRGLDSEVSFGASVSSLF